jgi:uncharacterized protein (DUF1778 family)
MPLRKTAVAISEDLLSAIDRAARSRGESRNSFITLVLQEAVQMRRDISITDRLNKLFADEELAREQSREAGELDEAGTDWSGEF